MSLRVKFSQHLIVLASIVSIGSGCGAADMSEEDVADNHISFEEFEAQLPRERGTGFYIVDGDVVIPTIEDLEDYYAQNEQDGALIISQSGGVDRKWNNAEKMSLTYCVSTSFGAKYLEVVEAMNRAANAWESAASVNFIYRSDQDGSCTASNNNVLFDVNPTSGQTYAARAFLPGYVRADRNILIDTGNTWPAFPYEIAPVTVAGILRHELGHVLGFLHEHIRPEANPTGSCYEVAGWRSVTSYDSKSVMHYKSCPGSTNGGDLELTASDKTGVASVYNAPLRVALRTWNGSNYVKAEFGGGAGLYASPTSIGGWETFTLIPVAQDFSSYGFAANNGQFLVADAGYPYFNRNSINAWETFRMGVKASGHITLRANSNNYLSAYYAGGGSVNVLAGSPSDWESFTLIDVSTTPPAHNLCTQGAALLPENGSCVVKVCAISSSCCTSTWSSTCVQAAKDRCGLSCP